MDTILQSQFQRVEAALDRLLSSIETYNPSVQAAQDLVAADDDLSRGLEQLSHHQSNHARILALRAESDALSTQLRTSVSTLASLRRELHETPTTVFPEDSHPVQFDELLRFAQNISKYTVPPTYREPIPKDAEELEKDKEKDGATAGDAPSNGLGTPGVAAVDDANKDAQDGEAGPQGPKEVTSEQAEWLKKLDAAQVYWTPWPGIDKIQSGNLHAIQWVVDSGKDPNVVNAKALWDARERVVVAVEEESKEQAQEQEQGQGQGQLQRQEDAVQAAAIPALPPQPAPAVFAGFDDFEEEE